MTPTSSDGLEPFAQLSNLAPLRLYRRDFDRGVHRSLEQTLCHRLIDRRERITRFLPQLSSLVVKNIYIHIYFDSLFTIEARFHR